MPEEKVQQLKDTGLTFLSYEDVIEAGRDRSEIVVEEPKPESMYMFCYTSGTTGDPKGVMITHYSFVSLLHLLDWFDVHVDETDIYISYLPYGHAFEQCFLVLSMFKGYCHGFYSGDPMKLLDDIQTLKPTMFCTVPRILNRVYSKIQESVAAKGGVT